MSEQAHQILERALDPEFKSAPDSTPRSVRLLPDERRQAEALAEQLAKTVIEHVDKSLEPVLKRIGAIERALGTVKEPEVGREFQPLEKRIRSIENWRSADMMKFRGVFEMGRGYGRGDVVQHNGTIWFRLTDSGRDDAPPSEGWRLLIKHAGERPSK